MRIITLIVFLVFSKLILFGQGEENVRFGEWQENCKNPAYISLIKNNPKSSLEFRINILDSLSAAGILEKDYPKYLFFKTEIAKQLYNNNQLTSSIDTLESSRNYFALHSDTVNVEYLNSLCLQYEVNRSQGTNNNAIITRLNVVAKASEKKYGGDYNSPYLLCEKIRLNYYYDRAKYDTAIVILNLLYDEYKKAGYFPGIAHMQGYMYNIIRNNFFDMGESIVLARKLNNNKIHPLLTKNQKSIENITYYENIGAILAYYLRNKKHDQIAYYSDKMLKDDMCSINAKVFTYAALIKSYTKQNDTAKVKYYYQKFLNDIDSMPIALNRKILYYQSIAYHTCLLRPTVADAMIDSTLKWSTNKAYKDRSYYYKFIVDYERGNYEKAIEFADTILPYDSTLQILDIASLKLLKEGKLQWMSTMAESYLILYKKTKNKSYLLKYERYTLAFIDFFKSFFTQQTISIDNFKDIQAYYNKFLQKILLESFSSLNQLKLIDEDFVVDAISFSKSQMSYNSLKRLQVTNAAESDPLMQTYVANLNDIQKQKIYLKSLPDSMATEQDLIAFSDLFLKNLNLRIEIEKNKAKESEETKELETELLSLKDIQDNLHEQQAILEYFVTDTSVFVSVTTDSVLKTSYLKSDSTKLLVKNLLRSIKTGENYSTNELSSILLPDFQSILKNKSQLIIIPHSWINSIPFEALNVPESDHKLAEKYSISYNISMQTWLACSNKTKQDKEKSLLAIAPVFDEKLALADTNLLANFYRGDVDLLPLPYTEKEIKQICKIFKSNDLPNTALSYSDATEENFYKNSSDCSIIHFSTHGINNNENFERSGIYFTQDENLTKSFSNNDNFLSLGEVFAFNEQPDLVVLSACKTGTGKIVEGEGVMALPRGFIYAGVPNVIASLWKVHDEKTKDLMVAFYKHLLEDKVSYAEALRRAKLDCIKKGFLPIDWAGFVLIGS